ncbi:MAG: hypothetical protein Tsb005_01880 [Gammaproteobacteria bacterium]
MRKNISTSNNKLVNILFNPLNELCQGILKITSTTLQNIDNSKNLLEGIDQITHYLKIAPPKDRMFFISLLHNKHYRALVNYSVELYCLKSESIYKSENLQRFNGATDTKALLSVLKGQLSNSNNPEIKTALRHVIKSTKIMYDFEKAVYIPQETDETSAKVIRERAFHILDWIPAFIGTGQEIFINMLLQAAIHLQLAQAWEVNSAIRMADQQTALGIYLLAFEICKDKSPDILLYFCLTALKGIAKFKYTDATVEFAVTTFKRYASLILDFYPIIDLPQANTQLRQTLNIVFTLGNGRV